MKAPRHASIFALLLCPLGGFAQDPFTAVHNCVETCTEDSLEVVFENDTSIYGGPLEPGTRIDARIIVDVRSEGIQGWSYGVRHDAEFLSIVPDSVTTAGTIADPDAPGAVAREPNFDVTQEVEGGFISAVVLSFLQSAELPAGQRSAICHAAYMVEKTPECTYIEIVDEMLSVGNSPPTGVTFTVRGRAAVPRTWVQGLIGTGGACPELCGDGVDNDGDGTTDCDDADCVEILVCRRPEQCDDGLDNDQDGLTDCDDVRDCAGVEPCLEPELCDDGLDNDGDGLRDCRDPDCESIAPCPGPEICDDGLDNDHDGAADCSDADCQFFGACVGGDETCDDDADNDGDGAVDCADPDCYEDFERCPWETDRSGGIVEEFCSDGQHDCIEDSLEIVFRDGGSTLFRGHFKGETIPIEVVTETRTRRVQGWSYAVRHDETFLELDASSVTTAGTLAHPDTPGAVARDPNFDVTRAVDEGFISAVVLAFGVAVELPVRQRSPICHATYSVQSVAWKGTRIEFVELTEGTEWHTPLKITFTVEAQSRRPRWLVHGFLPGWDDWDCPNCGPHLSVPFQRGDADGNGRINIIDPVKIIQILIGIAPVRYDCDDALDADDDGRVTVTDALPLLAWIFQRGPRLPDPFLECGLSSVRCGEPSPVCH